MRKHSDKPAEYTSAMPDDLIAAVARIAAGRLSASDALEAAIAAADGYVLSISLAIERALETVS